MTYKINTKPTFWAPVTVRLGDAEPEVFRACFQALEVDEVDRYDLATPEGTAGFLIEAWRGIEDVEDNAGQPVAFSPELRDQMLRAPHIRFALVNAYQIEFRKAALGN